MTTNNTQYGLIKGNVVCSEMSNIYNHICSRNFGLLNICINKSQLIILTNYRFW
ncbi:MAG: hypothetical protein US62_C0026G0002 [Candidatus Woesebacteria bacterium GW2011_GWA1_37_8]|uniref:Uncharacterized protein n=2 Tax=Candidatus Woeseibacteriota TaxID=1752722 RepID=A0A0G0NNF9_9BACT|nr:MAG: hypothetical protein US62_C0026G0002 [Candidatus Woesebacteria bacterium GW2011_GWA1_37_8]KKQ87444.1 MAG: hypothetical protein UT10_C0006G0002 [Candidatus Woesebacteria bacterium GW2011_GWB1_38_8b]